MAESLILVNGLPGAGKTMLSSLLGQALGVPVLSKDFIKEALADASSNRLASRRLGQIASDAMWQLSAAMPGRVIVESWWYRPRDVDYVLDGIALSETPNVVEVWCDVPADLAWKRYLERQRHQVHPAAISETDWASWSTGAVPLGVGRVVRVDTSFPTSRDALSGLISSIGDF